MIIKVVNNFNKKTITM